LAGAITAMTSSARTTRLKIETVTPVNLPTNRASPINLCHPSLSSPVRHPSQNTAMPAISQKKATYGWVKAWTRLKISEYTAVNTPPASTDWINAKRQSLSRAGSSFCDPSRTRKLSIKAMSGSKVSIASGKSLYIIQLPTVLAIFGQRLLVVEQHRFEGNTTMFHDPLRSWFVNHKSPTDTFETVR
jgi:hypothetical protein